MSARPDVVIVGAGPVGLATAGFLGRCGWNVLLFDREAAQYPLPRAGHVDAEIVRLLQQLGVAERFVRKAVPLKEAEFWDKEGNLLTKLPLLTDVPSGWFSDYLMYQPDLDDAIRDGLDALGTVRIQRATEVVGLAETEDGVIVETISTAGETPERSTVTASYVIGADGANSFVRRHLGARWRDFGFNERWLVVDFAPHDPMASFPLPTDAQLCDPAQPTSLFRWLGREHLRLEFMLMDQDEPDATATAAESCWSRSARWGITPQTASLTRAAVYTFRSQIADNWGSGRIFIAGDAAHLMPPFQGQGMCSGLRDGANLAWKLDLALRGRASASLLDSYQKERSPHVQVMIEGSVVAGQIVCVTDPVAAEERDAALRALTDPPIPTPPPLVGGLQADLESRVHSADGSLSPQGRISWDGRDGLLEDLVTPGWKLITVEADAAGLLPPEPDGVVTVMRMTQADVTLPGVAVDLDAVYTDWLSRIGARSVIVRPDLYVFAAVGTREELATALERLHDVIGEGS